MPTNPIDLTELPEEARTSLLDYYEYLKGKYRHKPQEPRSDVTDFRGVLNFDGDKLANQLEELRGEWDRDV